VAAATVAPTATTVVARFRDRDEDEDDEDDGDDVEEVRRIVMVRWSDYLVV
jgi:hypothetical protein